MQTLTDVNDKAVITDVILLLIYLDILSMLQPDFLNINPHKHMMSQNVLRKSFLKESATSVKDS